jgi:very-short-patch-repair endonuclease
VPSVKQSRQQLCFKALHGERVHSMRHNLIISPKRKLSLVLHFRQVSVGIKHIADFLVLASQLIVEVDDRTHQLKRTLDARRDSNLARLGRGALRRQTPLLALWQRPPWLPLELARCAYLNRVAFVPSSSRFAVYLPVVTRPDK